ncbi:hypothetical protein B0F90DRAFT_1920371 [Multifurca ochricompacta]|uniref:Uncharacterized protein n=1 Tax=Multifurca ochricompacta TaxID=376703 RepID=A0AAD4LWM3_9AGAM|nr:hypothetical protein B0F90DRAFT_1920371 [Multifurca ochricompacta]
MFLFKGRSSNNKKPSRVDRQSAASSPKDTSTDSSSFSDLSSVSSAQTLVGLSPKRCSNSCKDAAPPLARGTYICMWQTATDQVKVRIVQEQQFERAGPLWWGVSIAADDKWDSSEKKYASESQLPRYCRVEKARGKLHEALLFSSHANASVGMMSH